MYNNSRISGFTIIESAYKATTIYAEAGSGESRIEKCTFIGECPDVSQFLSAFSGNAKIDKCTFFNSNDTAIMINSNAIVSIYDCIFSGNRAVGRGGAIWNCGILTISNSQITNNQGGMGGGICNSGNLTLDNCLIEKNISTDNLGADIFSDGRLTIIDGLPSNTNCYNEITGEEIQLPLESYEDMINLIYLTEEEAVLRFTPDSITPPTDNDENDTPDQIPEPPKETEDSEGESGDGDSSGKQPEMPDQPLQGEDGDGTDNNTSQLPEQPQKPIDSTPGYIPYWPSVRPVRPTVTTTAPTDKPKTEPETPARKPLICNGATIDTSKTILLLGYGDGQLHEEDSLTRAQLATIIFRLLDDDSVIRYGGAGAMFTDVAADAWYAPYVNAIGMAGIVNGVGNEMYDPNGTVTWVQIITILTRFVEPENCELRYIQYNGWALEAIQTAVSLEWIGDNSTFNPNAIISRGELVDLINAVLERY